MTTRVKIIDTTKGASTKTVSGKSTSNNFHILLIFLLNTIALFVAVSIYCYFIQHRSKQKHLLLFCVTNNKLKEILY